MLSAWSAYPSILDSRLSIPPSAFCSAAAAGAGDVQPPAPAPAAAGGAGESPEMHHDMTRHTEHGKYPKYLITLSI